MNRLKANIDNKNILEDFSNVFHDGFYVEDYTESETKQAFYVKGQLFELSYRLGENIFRIKSLEKPVNIYSVDEIRKAAKQLNNDNVSVLCSDCGLDGVYTLTGMFYFVES